jgi:uncharacterized protein (TIGR02118 family)
MITVLVAAKRLKKLSRAEFTDYWVNVHSPLVRSVPAFMKYLRRYVIYPVLDNSREGDSILGQVPDYDGIGEIRFDSITAMKEAYATSEYKSIILPDEGKFLDRDGCLTFFTTEIVQVELASIGARLKT